MGRCNLGTNMRGSSRVGIPVGKHCRYKGKGYTGTVGLHQLWLRL